MPMNCVYYLDGSKPLTELELDELLLSYKDFGGIDTVFSRQEKPYGCAANRKLTNHILFINDNIIETSSTNARKIQEENKGKDPIQFNPLTDDVGDIITADTTKGYIGVTMLMLALKNVAAGKPNEPVFPIFLFPEYEKRILPYLKELVSGNGGKGWIDVEIDLGNGMSKVFFPRSFVNLLFGKDLNGNQIEPQDVTDEMWNSFKNRLEYIWKQLALVGSEIHAVLSHFFSFYFSNNASNVIENIINSEWAQKILSGENTYIGLYINSEEKLRSALLVALKISEQIKLKYKGRNPVVYSEVAVYGNGTIDNHEIGILGKIDLLVLDDRGNVEIIDFKCSPKLYAEFDTAKTRTFRYLLAIYRRLILLLGLISEKSAYELSVIPILFSNFAYRPYENKVTFDNVEIGVTGTESIIKDIENDPKLNYSTTDQLVIENNISAVVKDVAFDELTQTSILLECSNFVKKVFPSYGAFVNATDAELLERVKEVVAKRGGIIEKEGGGFIYFDKKTKKTYEGSTEAEIINKIMLEWKSARGSSANLASKIGSSLIDAQQGKGWAYNRTGKLRDPEKSSPEWTEKILSKYATREWKVITALDLYPNATLTKELAELSPLKALESLGIILIQNRNSGQIDVLRFTNSELGEGLYLGGAKKNKYLLGTFIDDDVQLRDQNSLSLESVRGNIMLMETMSALNAIASFFNTNNRMIGNIMMINPSGFNTMGGLSASNKLLLYNFSRLCLFAGMKNNFYRDHGTGIIKMLTYAELALLLLQSIINGEHKSFNFGLREFLESNEINQFVLYDLMFANLEEIKLKLVALKETIEQLYPDLKGGVNKDLPTMSTSQEREVYNNVLLAIAEQNNMDIVLQLNNNPKYFSSFFESLIYGVNGSYSDNPGMLKSSNLNMMATATERGYLNVRVAVNQFNNLLLEKLRKLKASKNFGRLSKYTIGNLAELYKNMYDKDQMKFGRYQFKNPWSNTANLTNEEKEFLIFAIKRLALENTKYAGQLVDNNGKFLDEVFMEKFQEDPDEFLKVPLIRGDFASIVSLSGGILQAIKNYFKLFIPTQFNMLEWTKFKKHVTNKVYEFLEVPDSKGETQKTKAKNGNIYEMINRIKNSYDDELREKLLMEVDENGKLISKIQYYESNLEKILLTSNVSYHLQKEMNKIFPIMKAVVMGLTFLGFMQNYEFTNDILYALDYIKNKILGLPLEDIESWSTVRTIALSLASATSKIALAFNPVLLYLNIDGLWKDIMLCLQKPDMNPDGISAFSSKNMRDSFMWIIRDVGHFSDKPSLGEAFNRVYGINDMDINTYQHNIATDNAGIFNFWKVGFRFSSRPDYYNRLTIFGALLRELGAWDAHSLDELGNLVYDCRLDKRFNRYMKGDKSNLELYNKLKAMYLTMANEFISEGAIMPDGTVFKLGTDEHPTLLPRALTTKLSEGLKALGDKIYGYYAHEKRSMILSYTIGALFMQMHTYWSSKKNQWLSGHGFSQLGEYRQYSELLPDENGKLVEVKYWMDEKGEPTTEETGIPFLVWKGRPQEGIWITIIHLLNDAFRGAKDENGNIIVDEKGNKMVGWQYMLLKNFFGPDVNLYNKNLYRANLILLLYDLLMLLLLGSFIAPSLKNAANRSIKARGNEYIGDAFFNTSMLVGTKMLINSADDFNMINSIFGLFAEWTPFSIGMFTQQTSNLLALVTGDKDVYDAVIKMSSATRNTLPVWDFVKLNTLGYGVGKKAPDNN